MLRFLACLAVSVSAAAEPVTGFVFLDRNGNGARDANEPGLPSIVVSNQQDVVKTGADGRYTLPGPGTGVVFVRQPRGHRAVGGFWRPAAATVDLPLATAPDGETFSFIHASDTHISEASVGRTRMLAAIVAERKPDLVLITGDLVKDALRVPETEARSYYDLFVKEIAAFTAPVWTAAGNHENFGIERHLSLVSAQHPLYGKGMYRRYLGPNYYSFDRGKIHFIALDTVDIDDLRYYGHMDAAQLAWLEKDLAEVPPGTTVVTFDHIPFFAARMAVDEFMEEGAAPSTIKVGGKMAYRHVVSNAREVLTRLKNYRYTLALGGHFHAFERLDLQTGPTKTRFHLTAAVVGPNSGVVSSPSGVTLYRVNGDTIDDGEFIGLDKAK